MTVFPRRTAILIGFLVLIIALLAFVRSRQQSSSQDPILPPTPPTTPIPTPTPIPLTAPNTVIPDSQATPPPKNLQTGWLIYSNPFHQFTLEYPPLWKLEDYKQNSSPMASIASELDGNPIGFTVSDPSWGSETDLTEAIKIGSFTYQAWQGTRYQLTIQDQIFTIITATKSASPRQTFRINWIYPSTNGSIDTYLKPILNTFKFSTASPSASPSPAENP